MSRLLLRWINSGLRQVYLDLECLDGHLLASLTVPQFTTNEVNSGVALQMERMGALSPWSHWVVHIAGLVVFLAHHQHTVAAACILKVCKMINHTIKWAGLKWTYFSFCTHFSEDMEHRISARRWVDSCRGCSHFPHAFHSLYKYLVHRQNKDSLSY